ncbi:peptidylprolyl isomerase [Thermomonospora echinospora]|uniref:peptidylprolyl isomerase n=1 Tax=Thermomonospora echinospora TaxID=1992 RepID=A0A1H6B7W9_9ACTN|nr:FKBP-type peptidyl-prolyl cis-trans isomerase [Thermomonospora echinospora]SEG56634.1 peptidylprolyl isomerase [Thermomonospora echinospora]
MPEDDKPSGGSPAPSPRLKAKLPSAQGIKRPDFTPHGISGGSTRRTPPRPSALTAAQAKKRRRIMIAGLLVAALAVAGGTAWYLTRPGPEVEITGAFGKEPKVEIPKDLHPSGKYTSSVLIKGTGPALAAGDLAYVHLTYYKWPAKSATQSPAASTGEEDEEGGSTKINSTYAKNEETGQAGKPATFQVGNKDLTGIDKTLDKLLSGQTVGSRVMAEIPPADGFGKEGQPQLGISGTDSMLFVLDVVESVPKNAPPYGKQKKFSEDGLPTVEADEGKAPKVTMPDAEAPDKLVVKTLVEGDGPALAKGDTAVTRYQGQIWKNGKEFDSSWKRGTPQPFEIGTGQTVPGFDKGLLGKKVGSRVMLILPPKEGYGKQGNPQGGIKGDDTLVFIVDLLGVAPK